jgi:asparagine synthase (glutamine-hydrolysing)
MLQGASSRIEPDLVRSTLATMAASIRHRGPDDLGIELIDSAGLGFVRLSIIDLEGGHQPMQSPCGRYTLVFNGEIYNFRELRTDLQSRGRQFRTESDSEVLLAMYELHGETMLEHLNGMFAFMIHDRDTDSLFGARDRLGIKPLFYSVTAERAVFASELTAIRASGLIDRELDSQGLSDYLSYGFVPAPRTIYRGVSALPAGCSIRIRNGNVKVESYWKVRRTHDGPTSMEAAVIELEALLADAVRLRTVADVPLGAMLSGGIDSGLVTALLSRVSSGPVKTFSVGFDEQGYDELPWAKRVAEMYGTDHTEIKCRPDVHELVHSMALAYGQPFGDSSAIPTYLVCQEARTQVTVALSGDGGDEVFGGYGRHTVAFHQRTSFWRPATRAVYGVATSILPALTPGLRRLRRASLDERGRQAASLILLDDFMKAWLVGDRLRSALRERSSVEVAMSAGGDFEHDGGLLRFQHQDLKVFLANDILEKVDRASMLHSLEARVPLLDHRIVEFGLNLPAGLKNDGIHGKLVLRELGRKLLPEGHLDKAKTGFAIPRARWLREDLRELMKQTLHGSRLARDGWLNQASLDSLVAHHLRGKSVASALWLLMMAELWYRDANSSGASS